MTRFILPLVFAMSVATGGVVRAQGAQRPDPMTQRLAACVDVLSGVASGQLVDRATLAKSFKDAFEVANPGQTLDAAMKVVEKPTTKESIKP